MAEIHPCKHSERTLAQARSIEMVAVKQLMPSAAVALVLQDLPTSWDRLIGVVGLKELRKSIEDAKHGQLVAEQERESTPAVTASKDAVAVTLSGDEDSGTSDDETAVLMN